MANGIVLNIDTTKSEFQNPMVQLRQGDGNYQSLSVTATSNGEPFDLTGWTITFMGTTAGGFKIVDSAVAVTNALQGQFTYMPPKSWGQDQGEFKNAYFKFTKADETASGASFRVNVLDAVDLTAEEAGNYISVVDGMIDDVKTSMDSKLSETKQTLADTQSQANTVKTNVNNLNTSVNELKAQNNNIKTSDNAWTGSNSFTQQVSGSFKTREATFTDFAYVATHMIEHAGYWFTKTSQPIANSPFQPTFGIVEVIPGDARVAGKIVFTPYDPNNGFVYYNIVTWNGLGNWQKIAKDDTVVHNTGTETVAGDKTFTGNNTFTQNINGSLKMKSIVDVPIDLFTLENGNYYIGSSSVTNSPVTSTSITVYVSQTSTNGLMILSNYNGDIFQVQKDAGIWKTWIQIADNSKVVHNTGTEVINGDKTFMSGSYGLRVTTSGVQKTADGGTTWTNI